MMDIYSIMQDDTIRRANEPAGPAREDESSGLSARIAQRIHGLRTAQRMSLEALAARSGVSRSMISLIERNEASPTAVVLEKIATGLNVVLAALFDAPTVEGQPDRTATLARRADQASWRDPNSGYLRRNVSPEMASTSSGLMQSPIQIVDVAFPAGARVAYETATRDIPVHQQVWVLDGAMQITVGEETHQLDSGDCLAFALDRPVAFHNPTADTTRYAVVIATLPAPPRR